MADRGVIFDMDGVLVLSGPAHWLAWQQVAARHGFAFTRDDYYAVNGLTNADICRRLFGARSTPELAARIGDDKERAYRALVAPAVPIAPGCRELLAALQQAGARLAVGSSAPVENVDLVLDAGGLRPFFAAAVHAGMVARGKPAPDIFLRAAELLGVEPVHCVVVEDAPAGIAAARAAGMAAVGVATNHAVEELQAAGVTRAAPTLEQVAVEWLLR
jgi:beta-phosphoglucomutase family hydrolase